MFFSYKQLCQMANLPQNVSPEQMVKAFNSLGFEVESCNKFTDLEKIQFGKITELNPNPHNSKLLVCKVEFANKTRVVQTTATNVYKNMIVVVFPPGSRVNEMIFAIKEISNVKSEGMLSSLQEFGINPRLCRDELNEGITDYPEIKDLTLNPVEALDLDDYIFKIDILPNRSDAASYYVMAQELAAYFQTKVKNIKLQKGQFQSTRKVANSEHNHLTLLEAQVEPVTIKEQIFLAKHQIKSVNDATDLANLTLLFAGQPTHTYDAKKIGNHFETKAYTGELTVLGNKKVKVKNALVVHIDDKPQCIASVIGLEHAATTLQTSHVVFEMGRFLPAAVRQAEKTLHMSTDASQQGKKHLAFGTTNFALLYLTNRLKKFSQPVAQESLALTEITWNATKTNALAGFDLTQNKDFKKVLKSLQILGFKIQGKKVTVPAYRHDVQLSEDLDEEIFRFYGYQNLQPQAPFVHAFKPVSLKVGKDQIFSQGYQEVRTYTLVSKSKNVINPFQFAKPVKLQTFVSQVREEIRFSQAVSLLDIADYNIKRGMKDFSLFSEGMIHDGIFTQAFLSTTKNFRVLQQDIVNLWPKATFTKINCPSLHPGVSAAIWLNNKMVGWIAQVHPKLTSIPAVLAEVQTNMPPQDKVQMQNYPNQPLQFEDVTFSLKSREEIRPKIANLNAYSVKVIDEFQDEKVLKVTVRIVR